jgi:thymidine phosphorylase
MSGASRASWVAPGAAHLLRLKRLHIDTYLEPVAYMRSDSHVCRSEGFEAHSRIRITLDDRDVIATLNVVHGDLLALDQVSLSESAWKSLAGREGDIVTVTHPEPVATESLLRRKVYGHGLSDAEWRNVIADIVSGRFSDLHVAALVSSCVGDRLSIAETLSLTRAMVDTGQRIRWDFPLVCDKHCVGGLPGNRTTPIVVAIVAAGGLPIPKTSSRAITSPAGTADTMEMLAPVDLDLAHMRRVVEQEGGCVVWGGRVQLSPADDILISVSRALDFDSDGQMVASVLSKKAAAGSTHVVIDMPVGPTAKVRSAEAAEALAQRFEVVASAMGIQLRILRTDGAQPIGNGIGPALEARDILRVLQRTGDAPQDLRERALWIAGSVLEMGGVALPGEGGAKAAGILESGQAWEKFRAICAAQGGMRTPPRSAHTYEVTAGLGGYVQAFDNRRLARLAKLAGAPHAPAAGIDLHVRLNDRVEPGQPLFTLHAEAPGELAYAMDFLAAEQSPLVLSVD